DHRLVPRPAGDGHGVPGGHHLPDPRRPVRAAPARRGHRGRHLLVRHGRDLRGHLDRGVHHEMNNRLRDLPKSRAFSTGFKLFTGLAAFALTAALLSGFSSCKPDFVEWSYPPIECTGDQGLIESILGPITVGWKGGVGDHFVYTVLFTLGAVALFLAGFSIAFRDADPRSVAEAARTEAPPVVNPPSTPSYWPLLAAFSVALLAIGLVANPATFVAGAISLGVVVLMWTLRTWSERATGDQRANEAIRERIAFGVEVPLMAAIVIAAVALSLSRVFLTVSATGAVV